MLMSEIEKRSAEIREEMKVEGADLKALIKEAEGLAERKAEIIAEQKAKKIEAEQRKADMDAVISGKGKEIIIEERKEMTDMEVRSSKEYMDAFARYILDNSKEAEVRALLSMDVTGGTVPVPTLVDGRIRTAWERNEIVNRIFKTYFDGDLEVGYEISGTDAVHHIEGTDAPNEEELTLGNAKLTADYYKKWITVSDKVVEMGAGNGEAFVDYLYREFANKLAKAIADDVVAKVAASSIVGTISEAPGLTTIVNALATLSDEVTDPVIIMNKATEPAFVEAMVQGNFAYDPFRSLRVLYNNSLPVYESADEDDVYVIVGDLGGVQGNFPKGEEVKYIFDNFTYAEANKVKIVGKLLGDVEVVQPYALATITKPGE